MTPNLEAPDPLLAQLQRAVIASEHVVTARRADHEAAMAMGTGLEAARAAVLSAVEVQLERREELSDYTMKKFLRGGRV